TLVCKRIFDPRSTLFNEPREILAQQLRQPDLYFAILEQLASGPKPLEELSGALQEDSRKLTKYLASLLELQIVGKRAPVTTKHKIRGVQYYLSDYFFRFWFRFVFPYQADLEVGLQPADLYASKVKPLLADHLASPFEDLCRFWTRRHYGS